MSTAIVDMTTGEILAESEFPWPIHPAAEVFPMFDDEALAELAEDIRINGLDEPLVLFKDEDGVTWLLDGRNRYLACRQAEVEPRTRTYSGKTPAQFVKSKNIQRRDLTPGQRAGILHRLNPLLNKELEDEGRREKARAAASAAATRDRDERGRFPKKTKSDQDGAGLHHPGESSKKRGPRATDKAGKVAGTSGRAQAQYKRILKDAPDLAAKVDSGEISLDRAERIIRDREAEQRKIAEARAAALALEVKTLVDIRHGDFREVLADLHDIDAIITDPPYPTEFLPLLGDLAAWADKVLKPDGILAVLFGQTKLPDVYRLLDGHRPYRWTACYLTEGAGYVSHPRRVQSNWKPLLVYGGGPRFADVIRSEGVNADAKNNHKWGQDYGAFHTIIERLTAPGQTVVDPFCGAGTTLLAARALGRHAIGCDIEAESVATAKSRVE